MSKTVHHTMEAMETEKKIALVVIATAATTAAVAATIKKKRYRSHQPYIHRHSLPHPLRSEHTTHWKELVSFGSSSDFVKQLNFDRHVFFDVLLPRFASVRPTVQFGSPYHRGPKTRGRQLLLTTIHILGLVLK